ncbi:hypothetical protein JCM11491_004841 [Sporobolomyces phaffii]
MHNPFSLSRLIEPADLGHEPVTAVLLHADRIMLGTDKGTVLVFDLSNASTSSAPPAATLVSRHPGLSKKSIDQLGVVKELNALVCLSGGDLTLLSLPDLSPLSSFASQTRGTCSLFALSSEIHHPANLSSESPGIPEIHTTLALACRRRLLLLSWVDGTWNPQVEASLPHQIRGMAFEGRKIVAGFSTGDYGIVSLPPLEGRGSQGAPTLGDLFSLPLPIAERGGNGSMTKPSQPTTTSLGGLSNFGLSGVGAGLGALSGLALGKKLEKNGVVGVPRSGGRTGKGKMPQRSASGDEPVERNDEWLWSKAWGWDDDPKADDREVLVVRDNVALPVSAKGKPRASSNLPFPSAITYSTTVDESVVLPPYVVSLLAPLPPAPATGTAPTSGTHVLDIHALESLAPVQYLAVPPSSGLDSPDAGTPPGHHIARLLTASPSTSQPSIFFITSPPPVTGNASPEQTLWIGTMDKWEDQIEELGRQGQWEQATRLLRQSFALSGRTSLPPPLLRRLATLHALNLFRAHRYALAIDAFIRLDLSPAKVVALYPETVSGKLFVGDSGTEELFGGRTKAEVERQEAEDRARRPPASERDADEIETNASYSPARKTGLLKEDDEDRMSIRSVGSRLTGKRSWLREREPSGGIPAVDEIAHKVELDRERQAKIDHKNYTTSIDELIRYLTDRRQKYSQALAASLPSSRPSPSTARPTASAGELFELPDVPLAALSSDQLARTAQVVDTALFRSYLETKAIMIGPLCRIENWCEVEEVEELLLQAKKRRELLDLYNGKSMHSKAVKLLRQMSDDEEDPEEKLGDTVRYLQKLGPDHLDVILEASKWVFEQDKRAGLEIFVADLEEVESLPRHLVLAHLDSVDSRVCIDYLEHIIHGLGEQGSEFHEKLIELYLGSVRSAEKQRGEDGSQPDAYTKLVDFLETSTSYRAERILGRLPSEDLHEVRAILLGRLGRHEGALQIYVYQLEDHATAEQYCKRVYDSDESMRSTIFPLLLRLYLRPRPSHPLLFGPALSLLSTHAARIDPLEAFELLPPLVSLDDMQIYLKKTLRRSTERRREAAMVKNVARSWVDQTERDLVDLEERRVKITESRVCPQCYKRIGNSVIAIHNPHGEVTHYQCREQFREENRSTSVGGLRS